MYKLTILFVFILTIHLNAQTTLKDTTVRKYLILNHKYYSFNKKIKEDKNLLIVHNNGKRRQGRLTIIDDNRIVIKNKLFGNIDTFYLSDIKRIRRPTVLSKFASIYILAGSGLKFVVAGLVYEDGTFPEIGHILVAGGIVGIMESIAIYNGKRYNAQKYNYKVITTKGFKLKQKYIKHLLS